MRQISSQAPNNAHTRLKKLRARVAAVDAQFPLVKESLRKHRLQAMQAIAAAEKTFLLHHCAEGLPAQLARFSTRRTVRYLFLLVCFFVSGAFLLFWTHPSGALLFVTSLSLLCSLLIAWVHCFVFLFYLLRSETKNSDHEKQAKMSAKITLLLPLFREEKSVAGLLSGLDRLDYPPGKCEIFVLCEEEDHTTCKAVAAWLHKHSTRHFFLPLRVPRGTPQTKPRALNYGLVFATGDIVGVYDAEDRPPADQLVRIETLFAQNPSLTCLQAALNFYNADQNWLTRLFSIEYAFQFDVAIPGLLTAGSFIPLGGSSNFLRIGPLLAVGGWDAYNVTEDADLGLCLAYHGYQFSYSSSTTLEEAPVRLHEWLKQRARWQKGHLLCYISYLVFFSRRQPPMGLRFADHLCAHIVLGAKVLRSLLAPFALTVLGLWLGVPALFPEGLNFFLMLFALWIPGHFLSMALLCVATKRRFASFFLLHVLSAPVYELFSSIASWMGLIDALRRPYYWSKTMHFKTAYARLCALEFSGEDDASVK